MFGMALSIGLLVDDAIVVVENVERVMAEEGLSPREATRKSMDQITGALVGHRAGAGRGVRAHGVLRRLDRRHLPPVLHHAGVGHEPVGAGGAGPHAGAVRHDPQAAAAVRARGAQGLLPLVQPHVRRGQGASRARPRRHAEASAPLDARVSRHRGWSWACCSRASRRRSCRPRIRASLTDR